MREINSSSKYGQRNVSVAILKKSPCNMCQNWKWRRRSGYRIEDVKTVDKVVSKTEMYDTMPMTEIVGNYYSCRKRVPSDCIAHILSPLETGSQCTHRSFYSIRIQKWYDYNSLFLHQLFFLAPSQILTF